MNRQIAILSLGAAVLVCTSAVFAVERLVPSEYATIQAAINDCNNGDVVIVEPNTYTGPGNRDIDFLGKAITVRSSDPNDANVVAATVIDCEASGRGFHFYSGETASSVVAGLTITNGYALYGAGIFCEGSSPTVSRCTFSANTAEMGGGGIENLNCSTVVENCIFTGNLSGGSGGGIENFNSPATVRNCVFWGNLAGTGGGVQNVSSSAAIINCTFSDNYADQGGAINNYESSGSTVTNCILWGDSAYETPEIYGDCSASYSDVEGGYAGPGNIAADPCFVDPAGGDYHLSAGSPCVDSGDPAYSAAPGETDIDDEPRLMGIGVDMGADEFTAGLMPVIEVSPTEFEFSANEGGPNPASQILSISNSGLGTLDWEITEDCSWLEAVPGSGESSGEVNEVTLSVDIGGLSWGQYSCELTISDPCAWNSPQTVDVNVTVVGPIIELSASQFEFSAGLGGANPDDQTLTIRNSGGGRLDWQIDEECTWLSTEPNSGTSRGEANEVALSIDIAGLAAGSYNCQLTVSDPNAQNTPQLVSVSLAVQGPVIELSASAFTFTAEPNGPDPNDQVLNIRNSGGGRLDWQIIEDCNWLSVEPNTGSSTGEADAVTLEVEITGLERGQYSCDLTVWDSSGQSSPQTVGVELYVGIGLILLGSTEYPTIQAAIDAAVNGDTVVIFPGTYTGPGNRDIDFLGKAITVRSADPDNSALVAATVIDCQANNLDPHRGFYFHNGENTDSVLAGLTITNGCADGGGGIRCDNSSPLISKCVIRNNRGRDGANYTAEAGANGGGIYCSGSSAIIVGSTVASNAAGRGGWDIDNPEGDSGHGGGIYCTSCSLTITGCTISNNQAPSGWCGMCSESDAGNGGGMFCDGSSLTITESTISGNITGHGGCSDGCSLFGNPGDGGGAYFADCSVNIIDSTVSDNGAGGGGAGRWAGGPGGSGGGIWCTGSLTVANSVLRDNSAGDGVSPGKGGDGGGIYLGAGAVGEFVNCLLVGNATGEGGSSDGWFGEAGGDGGNGGAVCCAWILPESTTIRNCTFTANATGVGGIGMPGWPDGHQGLGGAVFSWTHGQVTDSIIWANVPDQLYGVEPAFCDVEGGGPGAGNIDADPCFAGGPLGDYYLSQVAAGQGATSPCVDAGSDLAANLGMDIYRTRTDEIGDANTVDMGYHYPMPNPADIDGDGDVDFIDYAILGDQWQQVPGIPSADIAPPGGDGIVDGKDLALVVDNWLWGK